MQEIWYYIFMKKAFSIIRDVVFVAAVIILAVVGYGIGFTVSGGSVAWGILAVILAEMMGLGAIVELKKFYK
jgi:hypothetical protein